MDPGARIVALSGDSHGYYSRPGLAYYLANDLPEARLFPFAPAEFDALGVTLLHARAENIDAAAHAVTLSDGTTLDYDRLLVATGSSAMPAGVPGAELEGVVKLDDLDDARDIVRRCRGSRTAVVVGGGITALEIVEGLRARHVRVHYLMRRGRYWSDVLAEPESRLVEEGLRERGVRVHTYTRLSEIVGRAGRVVAVRTEAGEEIPCDMVASAIGVRPEAAIARDAGLACARGVLVDRYLRSSDPDIFAAGDVAEVLDEATGQGTLEVLWGSAVSKGRIAGHNMAAEQAVEYRESVALNVSRLAGVKITIIGTVGSGESADLQGLSRGDSETWRNVGGGVTIQSHDADCHVRLEVQGGVIVGAVVMGDQTLSYPLQELIESRADVRDVLGELRAPRAPVVKIVNGLWEEMAAHRV